MRKAVTLAAFAASLVTACSAPAAEISSDIGYPTVAAARQAMQKEQVLSYTMHQGEEVIIVGGPLLKDTRTYWLFASEDHDTYPMACRFDFIREGDDFALRESMRCEGNQASCIKAQADARRAAEGWRRHILAPKAFKY